LAVGKIFLMNVRPKEDAKMINKITLKNFKSHKKSELNLSPGINIIVGKSDNGKTAILKGLKWVKDNRPGGNAFISDWIKEEKDKIIKEKQASISIVKNNSSLFRYKTNEKNGYNLDGQNYLAVKTDVPESVQKFLNLTGINYQSQFDGPFLLNETPGGVAKYLNELVKLDEIDQYLFAIESKRRKSLKDKREIVEEIKILESDLENLDWVGSAQKLLIEVEKIHNEIESMHQIIENLKNDIIDYKKYITILNNIIDINLIEKKLKKLKKYRNRIEDLLNYSRELSENIINYKKLSENINNYNIIIEKNTKLLPESCPLCGNKIGNKMEI
jgi:exonuclease SbcC